MKSTKTNSSISGLIVIDKPEGMSSRQAAVKVVKTLSGKVKFGHVGTLDPAASGVLPVLLGHATKCMDYLHCQEKIYEFDLKLGESTDTLDREGEVVETAAVPEIDIQTIHQVLPQFLGEIEQVPPLYSAVKSKGQSLYKLARKNQGDQVDLESFARKVEIFDLQLLNWNADEALVTVQAKCGKGTYIRSLGRDLARALGTVGYLTRLRRLKSSGFSIENAVSLDRIEAEFPQKVIAIEDFPFAFPSWKTSESLVKKLFQGQTVVTEYCDWKEGLRHPLESEEISKLPQILLLDEKGKAAGICRTRMNQSQKIELRMQRGLQ